MWLIYYKKDDIKGWFLSQNRESLQQWADENLDTSLMSGEDECEIVDLARRDLVEKLNEANKKLTKINEIIKMK